MLYQFVDAIMLMRVLKNEAKRRVAFLTAEKSMRKGSIGFFSRSVGSIPVARAQDLTKPGPGKIYLPDPEHDALLVRGVGTQFDSADVQVGGLLALPTVNGASASAEILEIHGPEEVRLKKEFRGADAMKQLTGREDVGDDGQFVNGGSEVRIGPADGFEGTSYKIAPKVDQTKVYDAVFDRLSVGECVGIFPEGGSHDRTELLPLKGLRPRHLGYLVRDAE